MARIFILIISVSLVLLSSCTAPANRTNSDQPSATEKRFPIKGKVISVDKAKKTAEIEHEEIPGYMDAMTMPFKIHEDWVWDTLVPGADIQAEMVVDSKKPDGYWLERIVVIGKGSSDQGHAPEEPALIGKDAPATQLTDQNGKRFTLRDHKGKAIAVTFIYAACPLPEFCIKMSRHFANMANQLAADPEIKDKVRLLSISFDPANDTPEKLKQYGLGYLGPDAKDDLTIWNLAVGGDKEIREIADFFGLKYERDQNDKTQFNHTLVTAVIGPDGKVAKVFRGGDWMPEQVINTLKAAAEGKASGAAANTK